MSGQFSAKFITQNSGGGVSVLNDRPGSIHNKHSQQTVFLLHAMASMPPPPSASPRRRSSTSGLFDGPLVRNELQAATAAFHRARGHRAGLDFDRFRDTLVHEACAAMPVELAQRVFNSWNSSGSGELSLEEFIAGLAVAVKGSREEHIRFVFELMDRNHHGKISLEDTAAFLRFFGSASTVVATRNLSETGAKATASCSIAQFGALLHPTPASTLTADKFRSILANDSRLSDSFEVIDWIRALGDRLLPDNELDGDLDGHHIGGADHSSGKARADSGATAQTPVQSLFQPRQFSRHTREAVRREFLTMVHADETAPIKAINMDEIADRYRKATGDDELVEAIGDWVGCMQTRQSTNSESMTEMEQWREHHKLFALGLCCAQSSTVHQVYRSLFVLLDQDNRGRLTANDLANFLFLTSSGSDRTESERSAASVMPTSTLTPSASSPLPSPSRRSQTPGDHKAIMTFMQFTDIAQLQNDFSASNVEVALLLLHLRLTSSLGQTAGSDMDLAARLLGLCGSPAELDGEVPHIKAKGFYLCEQTKWRQLIKQTARLNAAESSNTANRLQTKLPGGREIISRILEDEAENLSNTHVLVPLSIWVVVSYWYATREDSRGAASRDWQQFTTSSKLLQLGHLPRSYHLSVSLTSTAKGGAVKSTSISHVIVAEDCSIHTIVNAACFAVGWQDARMHHSADRIDSTTLFDNYDCHLAWSPSSTKDTIATGRFEIAHDLMMMPLSLFVQNLPTRDDNGGAPNLCLEIAMSDRQHAIEKPAETVDRDHVSSNHHRQNDCWTVTRGLCNLGNTCFMNSALQALVSTPLLRQYFLQGEYKYDMTPRSANHHKHLLMKREERPSSLARAFSQLLQEMTSLSLSGVAGSTSAVSPVPMYVALGQLFPYMCDGTQQDAQEFISTFINKLSEELRREPAQVPQPGQSVLSPHSRTILSRISTISGPDPDQFHSNSSSQSKGVDIEIPLSPRDSNGRHDRIVAMEWWVSHLINEPSVITGFFSGQYKSVLTCTACGKKSTRFEPYSSLQLPIANREKTTFNSFDAIVILHFADSPRFRLPRRIVVQAKNDWTIQELLADITHAQLESSQSDPQSTTTMLVAAVLRGATIQDLYDDDMLVATIPMPIHVLELDGSNETKHPSESTSTDAHNPALVSKSCDPGDEILVKITQDRIVKGLVKSSHCSGGLLNPSSPTFSSTRDYDVLLTEGLCNGRTVYNTTAVLDISALPTRPLYMRFVHRRSVFTPFYCTTPYRQVVCGTPFIVRTPAGSITGSSLYNLVSRRFFGRIAGTSPRHFPQASADSTCRFVLRRVRDDGTSCARCHWLHNCSGCEILHNKSDLLDLEMDETIAIDWEDDGGSSLSWLSPSGSVKVQDAASYRKYRAEHSQSVAESFAMLCEQETVDVRCTGCRNQQETSGNSPHTKQLSIWSVPPVLVLQLKRFELAVGEDGDYRWQKLSHSVDFPVKSLDLSPFLSDVDGVHDHDAECTSRCTDVVDSRVLRGMAFLQDELGLHLDSASRACAVYDLYAVIHHAGALNAGHYTATVRHSSSAGSDDWWLVDDATVARADPTHLSPSATAYVLFYVRRDVATSASDLVEGAVTRGDQGDDPRRVRRAREFFPRRPHAADGSAEGETEHHSPPGSARLHARNSATSKSREPCNVM